MRPASGKGASGNSCGNAPPVSCPGENKSGSKRGECEVGDSAVHLLTDCEPPEPPAGIPHLSRNDVWVREMERDQQGTDLSTACFATAGLTFQLPR